MGNLGIEEPQLFTSVSRICAVCSMQFSKYKCPKCSVQTCGLMCYRAHGERCTESFYEAQTAQDLHATRATSQQRREMLATLARHDAEAAEEDALDAGGEAPAVLARPPLDAEGGEEDEEEGEAGGDDDDDGGGEEEAEDERVARLRAMLEEQGSLTEADLAPDEREAFRRQVADGSLGAAMQQAPAWWERLPTTGALLPCARSSGWRWRTAELGAAAAAAGAPALPSGLPAMRTLTSRPVPPSLRFTVLDVLASYAYVYRLFCNAPLDDAAQAAAALLRLSAALGGASPAGHASASEALLRCCGNSEEPEVRTSEAFGAACVADAERLCADGGGVALAMGGAAELLAAARRAAAAAAAAATVSAAAAGATTAAAAKTAATPPPATAEGVGASGATAAAAAEPAGVVGVVGERKAHRPPPQRQQQQLQLAKRKMVFVQAWWAALEHSERHATCLGLQFALRQELTRREQLRRASSTATAADAGGGSGVGSAAAATAPSRRVLVQEL